MNERKKYTQDELLEILRLHKAWLRSEEGGTRAILRGADLTDADLTDADLTGAILRGAILRGAILADAILADAILTDADLTGADLTDAILTDADLADAILTRAEIPVVENIDQRILALVAKDPDALNMAAYHTCETTHCRAGWAIHLAGEAGYKLENAIGSCAAGALIYAKSCPLLPVPNFYASNASALEDMQQRAGKGC